MHCKKGALRLICRVIAQRNNVKPSVTPELKRSITARVASGRA